MSKENLKDKLIRLQGENKETHDEEILKEQIAKEEKKKFNSSFFGKVINKTSDLIDKVSK